MYKLFAGEAVEFVLTKFIEKSVPIKVDFSEVRNFSSKSMSCKDWKSLEMVNCIEQILLQNRTNLSCRLPMTLLRGESLIICRIVLG